MAVVQGLSCVVVRMSAGAAGSEAWAVGLGSVLHDSSLAHCEQEVPGSYHRDLRISHSDG